MDFYRNEFSSAYLYGTLGFANLSLSSPVLFTFPYDLSHMVCREYFWGWYLFLSFIYFKSIDLIKTSDKKAFYFSFSLVIFKFLISS